MKAKVWLISWLIIVLSGIGVLSYLVYRVDPFFHYHKPEVENYYYPLDNQRSQNDGIARHFDYNAIITGTSMIENFRTSDMDARFDCNTIKLPFSGAYYKENRDVIKKAKK